MKNELLLQLILSACTIFVIVFFSTQYYQQQSNFTLSKQTVTRSRNIKLTMDEIRKHNTSSDCWLVIKSNMYDVSQYLSLHPGGANRIIPYCGQDATTAFLTQGGRGSHSPQAVDQLGLLLLGAVNSTVSPGKIDQQKNAVNNSINSGQLNSGEKDDD